MSIYNQQQNKLLDNYLLYVKIDANMFMLNQCKWPHSKCCLQKCLELVFLPKTVFQECFFNTYRKGIYFFSYPEKLFATVLFFEY